MSTEAQVADDSVKQAGWSAGGSGALQGAATGAAIGTAVGGPVGAAIGAGVGALVVGLTAGSAAAKTQKELNAAQKEQEKLLKQQDTLARREGREAAASAAKGTRAFGDTAASPGPQGGAVLPSATQFDGWHASIFGG